MLLEAFTILTLALAADPSITPDIRVERAADAPTAFLDDAELELRLSLGSEWDSNAKRAVESNIFFYSLSRDAVSDGLMRLLVDADVRLPLSDSDQIAMRYVLGAKRFFEHGSEDLLVHDLNVSSYHRPLSWLGFRASGALRQSRIRSGFRDYSLINATAAIGLHPTDWISLWLSGTGTGFSFDSDDRLSYAGPSVGAEIVVRPFRRFSVSVRTDFAWRDYVGNALVHGTLTSSVAGRTQTADVATFCDGQDVLSPQSSLTCSPLDRNDTEFSMGLRAYYQGPVIVGAEYSVRALRSTSDLEEIDRHRISASITAPLLFEITGSLMAALQISNGVSVTGSRNLVEDDENQNSLQAQLSRPITSSLRLDLRYALFANEFETADARFLRQTGYLGLTYRTGG